MIKCTEDIEIIDDYFLNNYQNKNNFNDNEVDSD